MVRLHQASLPSILGFLSCFLAAVEKSCVAPVAKALNLIGVGKGSCVLGDIPTSSR